MNENIKAVRRENWRKLVMAQKASGLTITKWCELNGIRARQFHYWQKNLRDNDFAEMNTTDTISESCIPACTEQENDPAQVFAEVPIPAQPLPDTGVDTTVSALYGQDSGIMIQYRDLQIRIANTFNEGALSKVLQVIRNVR